MILAMRKFIKIIHKYPGSIGGTVASISILISHAQMMSVVSNMDFDNKDKKKQEGGFLVENRKRTRKCLEMQYIFGLCLLVIHKDIRSHLLCLHQLWRVP